MVNGAGAVTDSMRQANVLAKAGLYLGAMIAVVLVIFRDGTKLLPVSARRRVAGENENGKERDHSKVRKTAVGGTEHVL